MQKKIYNKDNPHADIGKQKFRVRRYYTAWVEYEPVEVYANDYNSDYDRDTERAWKVAECVPYEDNDCIDFEDPNWTTDDYEWSKTGDEETETKTKNNMEVPF